MECNELTKQLFSWVYSVNSYSEILSVKHALKTKRTNMRKIAGKTAKRNCTSLTNGNVEQYHRQNKNYGSKAVRPDRAKRLPYEHNEVPKSVKKTWRRTGTLVPFNGSKNEAYTRVLSGFSQRWSIKRKAYTFVASLFRRALSPFYGLKNKTYTYSCGQSLKNELFRHYRPLVTPVD